MAPFISTTGVEQEGQKARETGTYHDGSGVPRLVVEGDIIPSGWTKAPAAEADDAPASGKARTGPANSK